MFDQTRRLKIRVAAVEYQVVLYLQAHFKELEK